MNERGVKEVGAGNKGMGTGRSEGVRSEGCKGSEGKCGIRQ